MAVRAGQRERLDEIEKRLEELRRRFDMYFQGSVEQRTPPTTHQAQMGGELRRIREDELKSWNTVDRFRFSQIFSRYVSMDRMWARTMKAIEDGTHRRDKFKVQQIKKRDEEMAKKAGGAPKTDTQVGERPAGISGLGIPSSVDGMDVDVGSFDDDPLSSQAGQRPVGEKPRTAPRAAAPASSGNGGNGMTDQRLKQLYDVYMQAKKRTGESSNLTMDALKKQLDKQIPAIKAKHKCETVDFKVVLKDGKAMLKAVPK